MQTRALSALAFIIGLGGLLIAIVQISGAAPDQIVIRANLLAQVLTLLAVSLVIFYLMGNSKPSGGRRP